MEQNVDNKIELKDKLISFYNAKKFMIFVITGILIIIIVSSLFLKINKVKNNSIIAEKYIQAGLYLSSNKKEESLNIYEEIVLSKNQFYSVLALNTILEKNLLMDKNKILKYFQVVEEIKKTKEQEDLITFKKALYLKKIGSKKEGNDLLKNLINKDSKLKILAKEIISE